MSKIIKILKDWTLPLAMLSGILIYLAFANFAFLSPVKPIAHQIDIYLTPTLIFLQLLLTFCKVNPKEFALRPWHIWLLIIQLVASVGLYLILCPISPIVAQGALVCVICPTATAAVVITSKLGGRAETLITYTMLVNLMAAIFVPLFFPLVYPQPDISFWHAFLLILSKVFPLLICPFIVAQIIRFALPRLHEWLKSHSSVAFYIWAVALTMVMGKTAKSIVDDSDDVWLIINLAAISLIVCSLQFLIGKRIGGRYSDRISGGQALGQKNTVLAIWMSYTYLNPLTTVAPGSYVLWQNIINSYQLWKKRKRN